MIKTWHLSRLTIGKGSPLLTFPVCCTKVVTESKSGCLARMVRLLYGYRSPVTDCHSEPTRSGLLPAPVQLGGRRFWLLYRGFRVRGMPLLAVRERQLS